ncbi:MAG: universal stress protein [Planctomycetota bacterium]
MNRPEQSDGSGESAAGDSVQPIQQILVPMDFKATSKQALEFAKRLLLSVDGRLHLLFVDDDPMLMHSNTSQAFRDEHEDKMAMKFVTLLSEEERHKYDVVMSVCCGTAYHEIETYAREKNVDLIVLGQSNRSRLSEMLLGSVSAHVIRHADCPVVSVPAVTHN